MAPFTNIIDLEGDDEEAGRAFEALLELADKYCGPIGVGQDLLKSLFEEKSDWAFIIQIDALNETACRDIIARKLTLGGNPPPGQKEIETFVSALSYQGGTSVIKLLKMIGTPKHHIDFVEAIRTVRNAFAHDIRSVSRSLMDVVSERNNKTHILRVLSYIDQFDEKRLTAVFKAEPEMLRFVILQQCMAFLYILHINLRDPEEGARLSGEA